MIEILWNAVKKIFGVFFCMLSPLKRLICRRKRHLSDSVLPLVNRYAVPSNTELEMEPWDSWGRGDQSVASKADQYGQYREFVRSSSINKNIDLEPEAEAETEQDFFQDMQPQVKKTAKIRLKKNDAINRSAISNRLAASTDIPILPGSNLEAWQDSGNAWEDSNADLTWQADAEMKENRRKEREVRSQEQQRKAQERAAKKTLKNDGHFTAVRLS